MIGWSSISFTNRQGYKEVAGLDTMVLNSLLAARSHPNHFFALCSFCGDFPEGGQRFKTCSGCQLVSYCSQKCQKNSWSTHRNICKTNSVTNGKNIFHQVKKIGMNRDAWLFFCYEKMKESAAVDNDLGSLSTEDETASFCQRAKLSVLVSQEWLQLGQGDLKILENKHTGTVRFVMHNEEDEALILNHNLHGNMPFTRKDPKTYTWLAMDYAKDEYNPKENYFSIKFGTEKETYQFMEVVSVCRARLLGEMTSSIALNLKVLMQQTPKSNSQLENKYLFLFPRVCNWCKEPEVTLLTNCRKCNCIAYCSEAHRKSDARKHKSVCDELKIASRMYAYVKKKGYREMFTPLHVDDEFKMPVTSLQEYLMTKSVQNCMKKQIIKSGSSRAVDHTMELKLLLLSERLSLAHTVLHVFNEKGIGLKAKKIDTVSQMRIHICSSSAVIDFCTWEYFIHRLPLLKNLYISSSGLSVNQNSNTILLSENLKRCSDCVDSNCSVHYSLHPIAYHMYFSSDDYEEDPDIIVVHSDWFDLEEFTEEKKFHIETSFRNMTHNPETYLVITALNKTAINELVPLARGSRPMDLIMPISKNPYKSLRPIRGPPEDPNSVEFMHQFMCVLRGTLV